MSRFMADCLVKLYQFWHGTVRVKGAGKLLRLSAQWITALQDYPVAVPGIGTIPLDFRNDYAYSWTNYLLDEGHQEEAGLFIVLGSLCSLKTVFWDVGANIGLVSGYAFRRFPAATFCVFEPNPDLAKRLKQLYSEKQNVLVTEVALSDRNRRAHLHFNSDTTTTATLSEGNAPTSEKIEVALETGDHFLSNHPASIPNLIKIDVEGHEVEVLRGCQELITAHRPTIIFEHMFLSDEAIQALVPPGYDIQYIDDKTGALSPTLHRWYSHNSILRPKQSEKE
jgi:FkbM family methyltransferase